MEFQADEPSDATAPTAIPKRNNVPVDPVRGYPNTDEIGQRVARPSVAQHAADRSGEQNNQSHDDKQSRPLICW